MFNILLLFENLVISKFISYFFVFVVIDNNGNLCYVGFYVMGFGCFMGNDLVDDIVWIVIIE